MRRVIAPLLLSLALGCATDTNSPESTPEVVSPTTATPAPGAARAPVARAPTVTLKHIGDADHGQNTFEVTFHNPGPGPVTILKPIDGSLWSWHLPYYEFAVRDAQGAALERHGRCGLSGMSTKDGSWPKDRMFVLAAGARETVRVGLPYELTPGQTYEIDFAYAFDPEQRADTDRDRTNPDAQRYPEGTWQGRATWSGTIVATSP